MGSSDGCLLWAAAVATEISSGSNNQVAHRLESYSLQSLAAVTFMDCSAILLKVPKLDKPEPVAGGMVRSINMGDLRGLSLIAANIPSADYLGDEPIIFGTKDTTLHWELDEQRKKVVGERRGRRDEDTELPENAFSKWSPYDATDGTTGSLLEEFRTSLSLTGWPYDD